MIKWFRRMQNPVYSASFRKEWRRLRRAHCVGIGYLVATVVALLAEAVMIYAAIRYFAFEAKPFGGVIAIVIGVILAFIIRSRYLVIRPLWRKADKVGVSEVRRKYHL